MTHRKELVDFEIKENSAQFGSRRGHEELLTSFEKSAVSERFAFLDSCGCVLGILDFSPSFLCFNLLSSRCNNNCALPSVQYMRR